MDWLLSIIRIAGVSFPGASSLVQFQAELDSKDLSNRIKQLEDPISYLHDDVPELSRSIYQNIKTKDSIRLDFGDDFYKKYSRALATLESQGCLKLMRTHGKKPILGVRIVDPSYIMYMCALEEDSKKMQSILKTVDECPIGKWLNGKNIQTSINLPLPVIDAVFKIYESKGYGLCSREIGSYKYMGKA